MLLDERKIRDHFSGSPVLDFRSFLRESVSYAIGKCVLGHKKRSAGIAMRRKGIMPQKRPAAGGETHNRASFLCSLEDRRKHKKKHHCRKCRMFHVKHPHFSLTKP